MSVAIAGFDEFMIQLAQTLFEGFSPLSIDQKIEELSQKRRQRYQEQAEKFMAKLATPDNSHSRSETEEKARELISHTLVDNNKWWTWALRAKSEKDIDKQEAIYKEAINQLPESAELHGNYALFLKNQRQDYDQAERYYLKALELDPNHANNTGNYALFLENWRKDDDQAERYYLKALELDPNHANNTGNYACFLASQRQDYDQAERYYLKALELDPNHANNTGNYALFLENRRKNDDQAEHYYLKALQLDPNDANHTGNYASFLASQRQDYDQAEHYYLKALELDPNNANNTANLIHLKLLRHTERDLDAIPKLLAQVILISQTQASQALAEALLYGALLEEIQDNMNPIYLGKLKRLLSIGYIRDNWSFDALFAMISPKLDANRHNFYRALSKAILDADALDALEQMPEWQAVVEGDPFVA